MKDMKKKAMEELDGMDMDKEDSDPRMEATKSALKDIQKLALGMMADEAGSLEDDEEPKVVKVTKIAVKKDPMLEDASKSEHEEGSNPKDEELEMSMDDGMEDLLRQKEEIEKKLAALKK